MNLINENDQQKACWQKKRFYSESYARFTAKLQKKRYGKVMEVYQCPYCEFWHLASKKEQDVK